MTHAVSGAVGARPSRTTRRATRPAGPPRHGTPPRYARHRARRSPTAELIASAWVLWLPMLAIAVGAFARLRQWAGGRSLWLDEVLIANNLVQRDFLELVREPLLHSQAAPVLWLWLERLCVELFGTSERSLRVIPLVAGLAALGLTFLLARQVLPRVLAPIPVIVVALHPQLIYYSNEVKQYSMDVVVVLVLILMAFRIPGRPADGPTLRRLAAAGVVAIWLSHASIFVLTGVSVVLVVRALLQQDRRRAARVALVLSPWLLSLAISYVAVLRPLTENQPLTDFWAYTFPTSVFDLPTWFIRRWYDLGAAPLRLTLRVIGLGLLVIGLVRLSRGAGRRTALMWAAVPAAMLAAALSAYPFASRLVLWLVPIAVITMAAALPHTLRRGGTGWLLVATAALTITLAPAAADGVRLTTATQEVEELRPLLFRFAKERLPGDLVYVEVATGAAFEYYAEQTGVSRDGVILFDQRKGVGPCDDLPALNAGRFATERVWVISSHRLTDTQRLGTIEDILARIRTVTREIQHLSETDADAWLFDPSTGPQTPIQVGERNSERCLTVIRSAR